MDHQRFNSLCRSTSSNTEAICANLLTRTSCSVTGRDCLFTGEGGNIIGEQSTQSCGVLFHPILGSQKERENEASYKPEGPEPMGGDSTLQNGGPSYSPRSTKTRRLASQSGLEGCLFHCASASRSSKLPEVRSRGNNLPVHLPSIRTGMYAPWVFTKIMKAMMTLLRSWGIRIIIYIDDILIMAKSAAEVAPTLGSVDPCPTKLGVHNQL